MGDFFIRWETRYGSEVVNGQLGPFDQGSDPDSRLLWLMIQARNIACSPNKVSNVRVHCPDGQVVVIDEPFVGGR